MYQQQYEKRFNINIEKLCKKLDQYIEENKPVDEVNNIFQELKQGINDACFQLDDFQQFVKDKIDNVNLSFILNLKQRLQQFKQAGELEDLLQQCAEQDKQLQLTRLKISVKEAELAVYEQEVTGIQRKVVQTNQEFKSAEKQQQMITDKLNTQIQENNDIINKMTEKLESNQAKAKEGIAAYERQSATQVTKILQDLEKKIVQRQQQSEKLKADCEKYKQEVEIYREKNKQLNEELDKTVEDHKNYMAKLKQDFQESSAQIQQKIQNQQEINKQLQTQIQKVQMEIQTFQTFDKAKYQQNLYNEASLNVQLEINELKEEINNLDILQKQYRVQNAQFKNQLIINSRENKELRRRVQEQSLFQDGDKEMSLEEAMKIKEELIAEHKQLMQQLNAEINDQNVLKEIMSTQAYKLQVKPEKPQTSDSVMRKKISDLEDEIMENKIIMTIQNQSIPLSPAQKYYQLQKQVKNISPGSKTAVLQSKRPYSEVVKTRGRF